MKQIEFVLVLTPLIAGVGVNRNKNSIPFEQRFCSAEPVGNSRTFRLELRHVQVARNSGNICQGLFPNLSINNSKLAPKLQNILVSMNTLVKRDLQFYSLKCAIVLQREFHLFIGQILLLNCLVIIFFFSPNCNSLFKSELASVNGHTHTHTHRLTNHSFNLFQFLSED